MPACSLSACKLQLALCSAVDNLLTIELQVHVAAGSLNNSNLYFAVNPVHGRSMIGCVCENAARF